MEDQGGPSDHGAAWVPILHGDGGHIHMLADLLTASGFRVTVDPGPQRWSQGAGQTPGDLLVHRADVESARLVINLNLESDAIAIGAAADLAIVERIATAANRADSAFDEIVQYWNFGDGERLHYLELGSLATRLVDWVAEGQEQRTKAVLEVVEELLKWYEENDRDFPDLIGVGLLETLDGGLLERAERDPPNANLYDRFVEMMGPATRRIWG